MDSSEQREYWQNLNNIDTNQENSFLDRCFWNIMKIAALIQAHAYPKRLDQLLDRLSSDIWCPYVHIDQKSDITLFAPSFQKAVFLPNRLPVWWGGFSQVRATLSLIEAALQSDATHFFLMSGQCFPIGEDHAFLTHAERGNLFDSIPMPAPSKPLYRITRRHSPDRPRSQAIFYYRMMRLLPERNINTLLRGLTPYAGANWWMLNRETVETIHDFCLENRWFVNAFASTTSSDEMFFQTILGYYNITPHGPSPTYTKWMTGKGNPNPLPLNASDWQLLKSSKWLMARKFSEYHPMDTVSIDA